MSADDPQQLAVYEAEDAVLPDIGRRLKRWTDVEAFVESVVTDPRYVEAFPTAPIEVVLDRRSRNARWSVAIPARDLIAVRDGSWNALTVLHELAHLVAPEGESHGPAFVAAELILVRDYCGFAAYGALRSSFEAHGVTIG